MGSGRRRGGARLGIGAAGLLGAGPSLGRWRRTARIAPTLVLAWSVAAFVAARLVGVAPADGDPAVASALTQSLVIGLTVGLVGAWLG